ncbi:MAG: 4-vinyl reductase [Anaerolineae bacterium]|nr:4-vinyl reductase [Anaerolineae bacterium]
MAAVKESKLYYHNKIVYIFVTSIEQTIGPAAMKTVFDVAGVPLKYYPPPNNFAKEFDFAYFSALNGAVDQIYGRGGRGLLIHAGRAGFAEGLAEFGPLLGVGELAFKSIPLRAKLKVGLKAMAETFTKFSDQLTSLDEADDYFIYTIHKCPVCWDRSSQRPICYTAVGVIEEGLKWVSGGKSFQVEEVTCHAAGDENCVFHIAKEPLSDSQG